MSRSHRLVPFLHHGGLATERTFEAEADLRIGVSRDIELNLGCSPLVRVRGPENDTASTTSPSEFGIASSRASRTSCGRPTWR
jgi:hypothetical protein